MDSTSAHAVDSRFCAADSPVSTSIPGEAVILDSHSGRYFALQGVGARVWELLQEPVPAREIVRTLVNEYQVDEATCERDVVALLSELRAAGLVSVDDSASS